MLKTRLWRGPGQPGVGRVVSVGVGRWRVPGRCGAAFRPRRGRCALTPAEVGQSPRLPPQGEVVGLARQLAEAVVQQAGHLHRAGAAEARQPGARQRVAVVDKADRGAGGKARPGDIREPQQQLFPALVMGVVEDPHHNRLAGDAGGEAERAGSRHIVCTGLGAAVAGPPVQRHGAGGGPSVPPPVRP